ncbi:MAG: hypothetical protein J0H88_08540 [Sphingomonadales bacterium]|nr:hypothetical protein [Sphingomonadales bacterium]
MRRTHDDHRSGFAARPLTILKSIRAADAALFALVALSLVVDMIGAAIVFGGDL